jgi:hypothetical protein
MKSGGWVKKCFQGLWLTAMLSAEGKKKRKKTFPQSWQFLTLMVGAAASAAARRYETWLNGGGRARGK